MAKIYEVAAFTDGPNSGSPTGVVLGADGLSDEQLQAIAASLGFSHSVFVFDGDGSEFEYYLRSFTALAELKSCAHATIAAHYLLASQAKEKHLATLAGLPKGEPPFVKLHQRTEAGIQLVELCYDRLNDDFQVSFELGAVEFEELSSGDVGELWKALQISPRDIDNRLGPIYSSPGTRRVLLPVSRKKILMRMKPDFQKLRAFCDSRNLLGCFAFALDKKRLMPMTAHARMFAPSIGVDEDAVNGNSSGCLGAYLHRTRRGLAADMLFANVHQGESVGRRGVVGVSVSSASGNVRTSVGGTAAVVREMSEFVG